MEITIILSAVVSLISLICFFVLVSNVSAIKRTIALNPDDAYSAYKKAVAFGDDERAKSLLKDLIWNDIIAMNRAYQGNEVREKRHLEIKEKWQKSMDKFGVVFPEEKHISKVV